MTFFYISHILFLVVGATSKSKKVTYGSNKKSKVQKIDQNDWPKKVTWLADLYLLSQCHVLENIPTVAVWGRGRRRVVLTLTADP